MVVKCEDVWREISNYFEGDLDPALKLAMEEHFAQCAPLRSVRDGMRNVVELYGDESNVHLACGLPPATAPPARRSSRRDKEDRRGHGS